jgi:hypothetical protein
MRRMMVVCAAAAMLAAGAGSDVAIARGGGGGGHGGGGHGGGGMGRGGFGFGGGRMGGIGFATAHPGVIYGHGFHGRHPFFGNRFAVVGVGGAWGYSGCYARVWTYYGWVWRNVCY